MSTSRNKRRAQVLVAIAVVGLIVLALYRSETVQQRINDRAAVERDKVTKLQQSQSKRGAVGEAGPRGRRGPRGDTKAVGDLARRESLASACPQEPQSR